MSNFDTPVFRCFQVGDDEQLSRRKTKSLSISDTARRKRDSSDSSGLSSISSESDDDFMSYSDLSSEESDLSSDDERRRKGEQTKDELDSDVDSIDLGYRNARMFLDLFEIDDFVR